MRHVTYTRAMDPATQELLDVPVAINIASISYATPHLTGDGCILHFTGSDEKLYITTDFDELCDVMDEHWVMRMN